jgi:hypothetical protein
MGMMDSLLRFFKSEVIWAKNIHCTPGGRISLQVSLSGLGNTLSLYFNEGEGGANATMRMSRSNLEYLIASLQEGLLVLNKSSDASSTGST